MPLPNEYNIDGFELRSFARMVKKKNPLPRTVFFTFKNNFTIKFQLQLQNIGTR